MSSNRSTPASRAELANRIGAELKRLRQIQTAAIDDGESLGLLVARLAEVHERLGLLVEQARGVLADGLDEQPARPAVLRPARPPQQPGDRDPSPNDGLDER